MLLELRHDQEIVELARKRLKEQGRSLEAAIDHVIERALLMPANNRKPLETASKQLSSAATAFFAYRNEVLGKKFANFTDEDLELAKLQHLREKYGRGLNLPRY